MQHTCALTFRAAYSQQPNGGQNQSTHYQMKEWTRCGTSAHSDLLFTLEREGTLVYATAGWDFVQNKLVTPTKKFYLCEVLHVIQHPTPSDRKQRGGYLDTGGKERTRSCGLVRTAFQYYKIKRFQHLLHNVNKHYWPAHLINCYMASPPSPKRRLEAGIQPSI